VDICCAFPPVPDTPEHIALAERLGYRRAWIYDTPALQLDVWMTLTRAAELTRTIEAMPLRERHLHTHLGHLTYVNPTDRAVITGDVIRAYTFTGDTAALRARIDQLVQRGVTEIAFQPAGPDIPRELTAFARMAGLPAGRAPAAR